jgi:hypothetical protein
VVAVVVVVDGVEEVVAVLNRVYLVADLVGITLRCTDALVDSLAWLVADTYLLTDSLMAVKCRWYTPMAAMCLPSN